MWFNIFLKVYRQHPFMCHAWLCGSWESKHVAFLIGSLCTGKTYTNSDAVLTHHLILKIETQTLICSVQVKGQRQVRRWCRDRK